MRGSPLLASAFELRRLPRSRTPPLPLFDNFPQLLKLLPQRIVLALLLRELALQVGDLLFKRHIGIRILRSAKSSSSAKQVHRFYRIVPPIQEPIEVEPVGARGQTPGTPLRRVRLV